MILCIGSAFQSKIKHVSLPVLSLPSFGLRKLKGEDLVVLVTCGNMT